VGFVVTDFKVFIESFELWLELWSYEFHYEEAPANFSLTKYAHHRNRQSD